MKREMDTLNARMIGLLNDTYRVIVFYLRISDHFAVRGLSEKNRKWT